MESQFKELKDMVNTTLSERKGHDDALELAKTRGKYHSLVHKTTLTYRSQGTRNGSREA